MIPERDRVTLVKTDDLIGHAKLGTLFRVMVPLTTVDAGREAHEQAAFEQLRREFPLEHPSCWTPSGGRTHRLDLVKPPA